MKHKVRNIPLLVVIMSPLAKNTVCLCPHPLCIRPCQPVWVKCTPAGTRVYQHRCYSMPYGKAVISLVAVRATSSCMDRREKHTEAKMEKERRGVAGETRVTNAAYRSPNLISLLRPFLEPCDQSMFSRVTSLTDRRQVPGQTERHDVQKEVSLFLVPPCGTHLQRPSLILAQFGVFS